MAGVAEGKRGVSLLHQKASVDLQVCKEALQGGQGGFSGLESPGMVLV